MVIVSRFFSRLRNDSKRLLSFAIAVDDVAVNVSVGHGARSGGAHRLVSPWNCGVHLDHVRPVAAALAHLDVATHVHRRLAAFNPVFVQSAHLPRPMATCGLFTNQRYVDRAVFSSPATALTASAARDDTGYLRCSRGVD